MRVRAVSGTMLTLLLIGMLTVVVSPVGVSVGVADSDGEPEGFVAQSSVDWWPMFHHDLQLTGYTTSDAPDIANLLWTYDTGAPIVSSPAVVDGVVYIGSGNYTGTGPGGLYALDAETGALVWSYPTTDSVVSSPAVADGRVFFGCFDGNFYALDAGTSALLWSFPTGGQVWSCPAVHDEKVFFSSTDDTTYALDVGTGTHNWSAPFGYNSAVAVVNGKVFVGTHWTPTLVALDESNGSLIWRYNRADDGFINGNGASVANGKVYFGIAIMLHPQDMRGRVLCLPENDPDASGVIQETEVNWTYPCRDYIAPGGEGPGWVTSTPAIHNEKIFVGSDDGYLYCLNATTGANIWEFNIGNATWSAPAVADGKVFFGAKDHLLYALDEATGGLVWSYYTGPLSRLDVSPAVADGKVFIGSSGGKVYAFGPPSPPPVGGVWVPVDKFGLLAPYIGLTILLAVAVVTVFYVKKRKRNTEIIS